MPPTLRIEADYPGLLLQLKVVRASLASRWWSRLTTILERRRWSPQALPYAVALEADDSGLRLSAQATSSTHQPMQVAFEAARLRRIIVEPFARAGSARARPLMMEFHAESDDGHERREPYACLLHVAGLDQDDEVEDFCCRRRLWRWGS